MKFFLNNDFRKRTIFNRFALKYLESKFAKETNPRGYALKQIADELGYTKTIVKVFFLLVKLVLSCRYKVNLHLKIEDYNKKIVSQYYYFVNCEQLTTFWFEKFKHIKKKTIQKLNSIKVTNSLVLWFFVIFFKYVFFTIAKQTLTL